MKTCAIADGGSDASQGTGLASDACFGVKSATSEGYQSQDAMNQCTLAPIVSEDIGLTGTALDALPGCNPIQSTQPAVIHPPSSCGAPSEVAGGSAPAPVGSAASYNTASSAAVGTSSSSTAGEATAPTSAISVPPTSPSEAPAASSSSSSTGSTSPGSPSSIAVKDNSGSETWTYQGCYTDLTPDRDVRSLANWGNGQTSTDCANNCFSAGYSIAGTEYGSQCFCGNALTSTTKAADSECSQTCAGDSSEVCGGASRLSVYAKAGTTLTKRSSHMHRRHGIRHAASF